jgi:hypothetical protein
LAFSQVRAEIRSSRTGRVRVELWVNALLNDGDDEGMLSDVAASNLISLGWEPEALGLAYLRHLRRDFEAVSAPRTGPKQAAGSAVTLSIVEGHPEGP